MSVEELKKMKLKDIVDIDASKLTSEEVAYIERRLVKEANRRLSRLRKARKIGATKLTTKEKRGFKSYQAPKGYKPSKEGSNRYVKGKRKSIDLRNKRVSNVSDIQDFLKKKTSRVSGVKAQEERYKKVIRDTLGKDINISSRQAKRISKLMGKASELAGLDPTNKKMSGSPRLLALIVDIVKSREYIKNDEAEEIIMTAITQSYEEAERLLKDLDEEDEEGFDVLEDDEDFY